MPRNREEIEKEILGKIAYREGMGKGIVGKWQLSPMKLASYLADALTKEDISMAPKQSEYIVTHIEPITTIKIENGGGAGSWTPNGQGGSAGYAGGRSGCGYQAKETP